MYGCFGLFSLLFYGLFFCSILVLYHLLSVTLPFMFTFAFSFLLQPFPKRLHESAWRFQVPFDDYFFHRVPLDPDIRDTAVASRLTAVVAGLV